MDIALAQLALVFMPGIIWANIDAKYGAGLKPEQTTLIIRAFMFGVATYSALFMIYTLCGKEFGYSDLGSDPTKVDLFKLKDEILFSIPLAFVLSFIWLHIVTNRLLVKFLNWSGATRRYGDEDVWSFTFNSDMAAVEYVHFRDLEAGYIFAGWVNTYSESEENRELLLRDAVVYLADGTEISKPPYLYISRPKSSIWIEFPYKAEGYNDVKQTDN